jgi:hypothetical protein
MVHRLSRRWQDYPSHAATEWVRGRRGARRAGSRGAGENTALANIYINLRDPGPLGSIFQVCKHSRGLRTPWGGLGPLEAVP